MWETGRGRRKETGILTHTFFFWSYHNVLSLRPHLALLLHLGRGEVINWRPTGSPWAQPGAQLLVSISVTDRCLMAASETRLTYTAHLSRGYLHISFHNTYTFPFNHVTASGYFHWCVLCKESLIDGSVKGQYAMNGDYRKNGNQPVNNTVEVS